MSSISSSVHGFAASTPEVSIFRLYLLRAAYLLLVVGLGITVWPTMIHHPQWTLWHGVGKSMLAAISVLAILGIRYPLKMLPLLFFEVTWKSIWLVAIARFRCGSPIASTPARRRRFETASGASYFCS